MKKVFLLLVQTLALWVIYWFGNQITAFLHVPVPGNVMGMILLFGLLAAGVVKLEQLEVASGYLLKHISFFFIPIAVGLMNWTTLFYQHSLWISLAIVVSAVLALFTVVIVVQLADRSEGQ